MTTLLGCIADDFTGATDLAGLLARSGVTVSLRIGVPDRTPDNTAAFEVIALKCRTEPVDVAVAECRKALAWLQAAGAKRFFWKYCSTFDSTPQGNIGPVAEALMADIGTDQTIYCPAFPENGRAIFMGNLFVGEQPLHESPMKDHPLTPMTDANLMRLLEPQVTKPVGLANRLTVARGAAALQTRLDDLRAQGVAHVIVDAVADEDLHVIAEACQNMALMTGGSAVTMPLPMLWLKDGTLTASQASRTAPDIDSGAIVLSGSCSAMTRAQVAHSLQNAPGYRLDPRVLAKDGLQAALNWLSAQPITANPIIYATADPAEVKASQAALGSAQAGSVVENALAQLALQARTMGIGRFVVAGGETSGAVTRALGVAQLDVRREIAPGVPWTFCQTDGRDIALALKSGNFGAATFFEDALEMELK